MALFLLFTGFSFWIPEGPAHVGCIALGIYLFGMVYSPGEGPVPFTYSAEAYPLYVRTIGMSLATATTWFFNALLSITWPSLLQAFKPQGAFGWYAAWNIVGWVLVLLFMPVSTARLRCGRLREKMAVLTALRRKRRARPSRNSTRFSACPHMSMPRMACARCPTSSRGMSFGARSSLSACMRGSIVMRARRDTTCRLYKGDNLRSDWNARA